MDSPAAKAARQELLKSQDEVTDTKHVLELIQQKFIKNTPLDKLRRQTYAWTTMKSWRSVAMLARMHPIPTTMKGHWNSRRLAVKPLQWSKQWRALAL
jgi:hypothetical protein